jgi:hypothetical protein
MRNINKYYNLLVMSSREININHRIVLLNFVKLHRNLLRGILYYFIKITLLDL